MSNGRVFARPVTSWLRKVPSLSTHSTTTQELDTTLSASEIEVARQVQAAFLPKTCESCTGIQVAARHRMSREIGGDLYDFIPGQDGTYSLVIGDVIGHELFSALVMSLIFGAIRAAGPTSSSPLDVVKLVNDLVCRLNDELRSGVLLCSLFYGTVDPRQQRMEYANAGHPAPILWRKDGSIEELPATCPVLGIGPQTELYVAGTDLADAYRLTLYTDGLSEARNPSGRFFDRQGIIDALISTRGLGVQKSVDRIVNKVLAFAEGQPDDDITIVLADFGLSKGLNQLQGRIQNEKQGA